MTDSGLTANDDTPIYPGRTVWRDVPTLPIDIIMAYASGGGMLKVTLGETAYDPEPDATSPLVRPVITLVGTAAIFESLGNALLGMAEQQRGIESQ